MARFDGYVNFTGGEISPQLRGRVDIDAYRHSCKTLTNFQPLPYGGVRRRLGTELMEHTANLTTSSRLIPFVLQASQAFVVELSDTALKVHLLGANVYDPISPYTGPSLYTTTTPYDVSQLRGIRFAQSGNFLVLCHENYPPYALSRISDSVWWFREIKFLEEPTMDRPIVLTGSSNLSVATGTGSKTATAGSTVFDGTGDIGRLITRGTGLGRITAVASGTSATIDVIQDFNGTSGDWFLHGRPVGDLAFSAMGTVGGTITITAASGGFRSVGDTNAHIQANDGVFKVTGVSGTTITAQVIRRPTASTTTGAWSLTRPVFGYTTGTVTEWIRLYPRAVCFHDQRLIFGGINGLPQTIIGSVAGDFLDFTRTDDPSDGFMWNADGATPIQHLVVDNGLLVLTEDAEYLVTGTEGGPITSESVLVRKQTTDGASYVAPVKVGREWVFAQRTGKQVIGLRFDITINGYETNDLTLLAPHITGGGILEMAFQHRPVPTLYCVRTDGKMACLTLDSKQRVTAWWLWETNGTIESIVTVPLAGYDEVWMVVRRPRDGGANLRYLERVLQAPYLAPGSGVQLQSQMLDSSRMYSNAFPTGHDTPFSFSFDSGHTARTVQCVDGYLYYGGEFVASGTSQLMSFTANHISLGLGYTATLEPMPPELGTQAGPGLTRAAHASQVSARLYESIGGKINGQLIPYYDTTRGMPMARRLATDDPTTVGTGLQTTDAPVVGAQGWLKGETLVTVTQDEPLPFHLLAFVMRAEVNP